MSSKSPSGSGASRDHGIRSHTVGPYERRDYPDRDEHLENFLNNWSHYKDRLTIFLGAGASIGARNVSGALVPAAAALRDELWSTFMCKPGEAVTLGTMTLQHACALIEARVGSKILRERVVARFNCTLPLWQHCVIPFLRPKAVFTTNYDNLVELGWQQPAGAGIPGLRFIFKPSHAALPHSIPLFKPHGTVEHWEDQILEGGLVLSLFDYFDVIGGYQALLHQFLQDFSDRCVVFVGYSFMDMDIGAEIYKMRKRNKDIHWYAVFPRNDSDVRAMYQDRFAIRQINRSFFDFLVDLDANTDFIRKGWKRTDIPKLQRDGIIQ